MNTRLTFAALMLAATAVAAAEPREGGRRHDQDRSGGEPTFSADQQERDRSSSRNATEREQAPRGGDFRGAAPRGDVPRGDVQPRNEPPPRAPSGSRWQADPNARRWADRPPDQRGDDRRGDGRRDDGRRDDDRRGDDRRGGDRRYDDRRVQHDNGRYYGRYNDRNYDRHDHYYDRFRDGRGRIWNYQPHWYQNYRSQYFRYDRGRYFARNRFRIGFYLAPRGYSYRIWRTGEFLPFSYYDGGRYGLDYWRYDLYEPPYWARWVRVGNDALLLDLDTGEIIDAVYDLFW